MPSCLLLDPPNVLAEPFVSDCPRPWPGVAGRVPPDADVGVAEQVVLAPVAQIVASDGTGPALEIPEASSGPPGEPDESAGGSVDAGSAGAAPAAVPKKGFVRRSVLPISVAAVAAFVAATAYLAVTDPPSDGDMGRWSATGANAGPAPQPVQQLAQQPSSPAAWPAASENVQPFGPPPPVLRGPPTRLRVKALGVDTTLETLHLGAAGALTPPKNFAKAGWYADGTAPGDQGPAVIAGHVDSKRGPAVFYRLREIEAGDQIDVGRGGKTVRFTVVSVAWYPKTKFPAEEVYGPTPDRQLRLITCGGVFDHRLRSYKDNLVVYAVAG